MTSPPSFYNIAIGVGCLCAAYYVWDITRRKSDPQVEPEEDAPIEIDNFGKKTSFKKVSVLWTTPEHGPTLFADISKIWRVPEEEEKEKIETPIFQTPEINTFWIEKIGERREFTKEKRQILTAILKILDEQGHCPSVVNLHRAEAENGFEQSDYQILEQIPLWKHSLRVASLYLDSVSHDVLAPDALIIGLGHDLGKIPSVYGRYYQTGDHPILARFVVDSIPEMKEYHKRKDVLQIIEEHHFPNPSNEQSMLLKAADTEARKQELGHAITSSVFKNPVEIGQQVVERQGGMALQSPLANQRPKGSNKMQHNRKVDPPPDWFNEDSLRKALRKQINVVNEGAWESVSMPNGIVWVKFTAINTAIVEASGDLNEVRGLGADRAAQSKLALDILSACNDCLVEGYLLEGQSATKCKVTTAKDKSSPMFLTPIKASWFFTTASALEAEKGPDIKRMVKSIDQFTN